MNSNQNNIIITDALAEEIQGLPAITEFLPHIFENGFEIEQMSIVCSGCKKDLPVENVKAKTSAFQHSLAVDAFKICFECRLITPSKLRFSDDGTYLTSDGYGNWKKR